MNKIYIVRHGQDQDNANGLLNGTRDTELTEKGTEQAHIVASKVKDFNIDIIYASPLKRAFETAQIIAKEIGIDEVVADQHLIERNFGILTGKPIVDIPKYSDKLLEADRITYFLEVEGGEDFPSCYKRAQQVLEEINKRHMNQTILFVAHGDIAKMLQAAFHGWTWEVGLKTPYLDNTGILELLLKGDKVE